MRWPFGRRRPERPPSFVPAGTRVYAVGDIHGRDDLLAEIRDRIVADARARRFERDVIVYIGDYVDRGLESKATLDRLIGEPLPQFESIHIKGNHDWWLLEFLHDAGVGPSWLASGGQATLLSYGVSAPADGGLEELMRVQRDLVAVVPEAHRRFLEDLRLWHEEGDYLFVHAGVRPGVPIDAQNEEDFLWIRREFLKSKKPCEKVVVYGHTVTEEPDVQPTRIGIDTGAFATNRLSCLVLSGAERRFIATGE